MSKENVDVARAAFGSIAIPGEPAAMIAGSSPDVEIQLVGVGGMPVLYSGPSGIREFFSDVEETWEFFRFEGTGYHDLGHRVLILGDVTGRGLLSGADVNAQWALIVELEESKAVRAQGFLDHDEALEAAGLGE